MKILAGEYKNQDVYIIKYIMKSTLNNIFKLINVNGVNKSVKRKLYKHTNFLLFKKLNQCVLNVNGSNILNSALLLYFKAR